MHTDSEKRLLESAILWSYIKKKNLQPPIEETVLLKSAKPMHACGFWDESF